MKIKLISSESLTLSSNPLHRSQLKKSKILGLKRREFIKLSTATAIGLTIPLATDMLDPDEADAGWINLIPIFLATMQIGEKLVGYGQQINARVSAENHSHIIQQGNIGTAVVKLVSSERIYQSAQFVDSIPPNTRNTYEITYPSSPIGQYYALAQSSVNRVQDQFIVS